MRISAEGYATRATAAIEHLAHSLCLVRLLDLETYWDLAAASCDAADNLAAGLADLSDNQDLTELPALDGTLLEPHRAAVQRLRPCTRPLGHSATASALDMAALARNILSQNQGR